MAEAHNRKRKAESVSDEARILFLRLENDDRNFFVTGKAGTGKSTLLEYFRDNTKKKIAVVAPTGVAALNIKGQTLHSFFGFRPDTTREKLRKVPKLQRQVFEQLEILVIDEISMVRADLLDMVDAFLRKNRSSEAPFGGVRAIFFGDLFQLPPVVRRNEEAFFRDHYRSPFFFDASVMREIALEYIELRTVYRQSDPAYIELLDAIRNNDIDTGMMRSLRDLVDTEFVPDVDDYFITLTTTNALADESNESQLDRIDDVAHEYRAEISGKFEERSYPAKESLVLKTGAQVMMLNNDSRKRWVNGSIGRIVEIREGASNDENDIIRVMLSTGEAVDVEPYRWEMISYEYDSEQKKIVSEPVGFFDQYPLMLAWAVTIHKSQGKTFDRVIIDFGTGAFAHGQAYVALSRCTTFAGMVLRRPVSSRDIMTDDRIKRFALEIAPPIDSAQPERISNRVDGGDRKERALRAIEGREGVRISYEDKDGNIRSRNVWPSKVALYANEPGKEILIAFDYDEQQEIVFDFERILAIE